MEWLLFLAAAAQWSLCKTGNRRVNPKPSSIASTTGGRTFQHMHHAKQNRRVQLLLLSLFAGMDILLPSRSG
jgi:hypothetical protein